MDENSIPIGSYLHGAIERSRAAEERAAKARSRILDAQCDLQGAEEEVRNAHDELRGIFKWIAEPAEDATVADA